MVWPLLRRDSGVLTPTELMSARLDGDVIDIGDAFLPADAVETAQLRVAVIAPLVRAGYAATHEAAAWVHGALADAPWVVNLQRFTPTRLHVVHDVRLRYRDVRLEEADAVTVAGLVVTTPVRTLVDLVRDRAVRGDDSAVRAMLQWQPLLREAAVGWLDRAGPRPYVRQARAYLASYEEVTRYTS